MSDIETSKQPEVNTIVKLIAFTIAGLGYVLVFLFLLLCLFLTFFIPTFGISLAIQLSKLWA